MGLYRQAIGVSQLAFELEQQHGLWGLEYSADTLQELADSFTAFHKIPRVTVVVSNRLGSGLSLKKYGLFKIKEGNWSIRLAPKGLSIAVILHELSHYLEWVYWRKASHSMRFKRYHESTISNFAAGCYLKVDDLNKRDFLNWCFEKVPATYEFHWHEGIPTDDLYAALKQVVGNKS